MAIANNKEKRAAMTIMHDDELQFNHSEIHARGNCWVLAQSSRNVMLRRTSPTEHTRLVPYNFTVPGAKANKAYAYQVVAFSMAYMKIDKPELFQEYNFPSIGELQAIERNKTADSPTLLHDCGFAACCNPEHMLVAAKMFNDNQEFCHHFMRLMSTADSITSFQHNVCELFHEKPPGVGNCWVNNYKLAELDSRRVTFSSLTPEEIQEQLAEGDLD